MFEKWSSYAMMPIRLILGFGFLYHGVTKFTGGIENTVGFFDSIGIPAAGLMAWVVALLEIFGGLALIAGAFVGVVSLLLIINMLVAMFTVHLPNGFNFMNQPPGAEVNLLYIAGLVALMLTGAGIMSVDEMRKGKASDAAMDKTGGGSGGPG